MDTFTPEHLEMLQARNSGIMAPEIFRGPTANRAAGRRQLIDPFALGFLPEISGEERGGYQTEGDLVTVTADGVDLNAMWGEYQQTLGIWNERRQQLVDIMTFPVQQLIENVPQVGESQFEIASEFGVPKAIGAEVTYFSLAYDYEDYDLATRFTWKFLRDADQRQIDALHQQALNADNRLIFRKVMEALFDSRNRSADIRQKNYTVYALYNGDGTVPPRYKGNSFDGSHSHYMVSQGAIVDSSDLEAMYENIAEHGYGTEAGTTFVLMCNKAEVKEIRKFKMGEVNNNSVEANYDFIPAANQPAQFLPSEMPLLGTQPPNSWRGLRVIGSYADMLIIEEDYIPSGYMVLLGSGGEGNLQNPVGLREHANPAYRGLRLLPGNQARYPLVDSFYSRGFGTGIRQRAGACIMQIKASGSYDIPSQYTRNGSTA